MAAGKTYDVMMNVPAAGSTAIPVFDRQLSLSANATSRDAGMLAYIGTPNSQGLPVGSCVGNRQCGHLQLDDLGPDSERYRIRAKA